VITDLNGFSLLNNLLAAIKLLRFITQFVFTKILLSAILRYAKIRNIFEFSKQFSDFFFFKMFSVSRFVFNSIANIQRSFEFAKYFQIFFLSMCFLGHKLEKSDVLFFIVYKLESC
jgi:hypothetical protein